MERFLVGHSILVVEDAEALTEVENPNLSAAILDHGLVDGNSSQVCERLEARDVPFINYAGFGNVDGPCSAGLLVAKPANPQELVTLVIGLLRDRQVPPGTMAENV
jgi:DNA-binding response OmpR family regulator